jgi:hypothetical protein
LTDEVLDRDFQTFKNQGLQFIILNVIWKYFEQPRSLQRASHQESNPRMRIRRKNYDLKVVIDFHTIVNKDSGWNILNG